MSICATTVDGQAWTPSHSSVGTSPPTSVNAVAAPASCDVTFAAYTALPAAGLSDDALPSSVTVPCDPLAKPAVAPCRGLDGPTRSLSQQYGTPTPGWLSTNTHATQPAVAQHDCWHHCGVAWDPDTGVPEMSLPGRSVFGDIGASVQVIVDVWSRRMVVTSRPSRDVSTSMAKDAGCDGDTPTIVAVTCRLYCADATAPRP